MSLFWCGPASPDLLTASQPGDITQAPLTLNTQINLLQHFPLEGKGSFHSGNYEYPKMKSEKVVSGLCDQRILKYWAFGKK